MKNRALVLAAFAFSLTAPAATLYDAGTYNGLGGNGAGEGYIADDFVLSGLSSLTGIRFWTLEGAGAYLGSINWEIRSDSSNSPGAMIASGNANPTRTNIGTALSLTVYENDLSLSVSGLAAGTYWFSIHDGLDTDVTFQDYYWAWTDLNATNTPTNRGVEFVIGGATWDTVSEEHAFVVMGDLDQAEVPEPTAGFLLGAGLLAAAFRFRKN